MQLEESHAARSESPIEARMGDPCGLGAFQRCAALGAVVLISTRCFARCFLQHDLQKGNSPRLPCFLFPRTAAVPQYSSVS
jgi:hypothetical protein